MRPAFKLKELVKYTDPDTGLVYDVTIVELLMDTALVSDGNDEFDVPLNELKPYPKPNEIWKTNSGRFVLVVEHPMTEVRGNLGFVWFDSVDENMNFCPLENQLAEKTEFTIAEWGVIMKELIPIRSA